MHTWAFSYESGRQLLKCPLMILSTDIHAFLQFFPFECWLALMTNFQQIKYGKKVGKSLSKLGYTMSVFCFTHSLSLSHSLCSCCEMPHGEAHRARNDISGQQPARTCSLSTGKEWALKWNSEAVNSHMSERGSRPSQCQALRWLQPWAIPWRQPYETLWARKPSLATPGILTHRKCQILNVCCVKPLSFRVICHDSSNMSSWIP